MNKQINITLTPAAIEHINSIMARHKDSIGFRLTMKKYGIWSTQKKKVHQYNESDWRDKTVDGVEKPCLKRKY